MISKIFGIASRVLNSALFSFKYLRNPLVIFEIPLKKEVVIVTKNGEKIKIGRKKFPAYIEVFQKGWVCKDGIYAKGNLTFKVPDPGILVEDFKSMYMYLDLNGKNILDIGGLYGETSVFFVKKGGAKQVFVYEPIKENYNLITENLALNGCKENVASYMTGVSGNDGTEVIESSAEPGSGGFGLPGSQYHIEIKVESWDTILKRHSKDKIFLAKVDCEGGEKHLLTADKKLIAQIPNWVIETHSLDIEKGIIGLFESLGYRKELRAKVAKEVNVWAFSK